MLLVSALSETFEVRIVWEKYGSNNRKPDRTDFAHM